MSTNSNSLDEKVGPKDGDIPFILCTPTKNDNDEVDALTPFDFDAEESPRLNFFLKPRRSCKCPLGCHHEQNNMSTDPTWNDGDRDLSGEELERNSSSSSSPVPTLTLQSFDVTVTPPVINLLKRRRRPSRGENQEGNDDDDNSSSKTLPQFPSLGYQHQHPALRRPVARRPR